MNPHGVSDQLNLEKLSSGCLRVSRVRQKPATPCVEIVKHKTINLKRSNIMSKNKGRVVGLDVHPDNFAGAVVEGTDPASAQVLSTSTRVELEQLEQWALRHTRREDTLVLEASGSALACYRPGGGDPGRRTQTLRCSVACLDGTRDRCSGATGYSRDKAQQVRHGDGTCSTPRFWL